LLERGWYGVTAYNLYRFAELFDMDIGRLITKPDAERGHSVKYGHDVKRSKIAALTFSLNDGELGFIINTVINLIILQKFQNAEK